MDDKAKKKEEKEKMLEEDIVHILVSKREESWKCWKAAESSTYS